MDEPEGSLRGAADYALFERVAGWDTRPAAAKAALATLYARHYAEVYRGCYRFAPRLGGPAGVDDLVQEAFLRLRVSAGTFAGPAGVDAPSQARHAVGWLRRVATNLYVDRVRKDKALSLALQREAYELAQEVYRSQSQRRAGREESSAPAAGEQDVRMARAAEVLAGLSERDQDVLLVSLDWYDRDRRRFNVPSDVIAALCEKHALRPDNYRQVRDRAFKKMIDSLVQAA